MAHEILLFLVPNITVASKDTGKPNVLIDFVKHTENLLWKKKKKKRIYHVQILQISSTSYACFHLYC